jgi:hypothetical protein
MTAARTYTGGCHCGRVRYEIKAPEITQAISCNCSICAKKGTLLTFVDADAFKLLSGEDDLADYQFHTKRVHHRFCKVCGIGSFGHGAGRDAKRKYSINVRCLDDLDVGTLAIKHFDGKSL